MSTHNFRYFYPEDEPKSSQVLRESFAVRPCLITIQDLYDFSNFRIACALTIFAFSASVIYLIRKRSLANANRK